jgi:hypothetical protein
MSKFWCWQFELRHCVAWHFGQWQNNVHNSLSTKRELGHFENFNSWVLKWTDLLSSETLWYRLRLPPRRLVLWVVRSDPAMFQGGGFFNVRHFVCRHFIAAGQGTTKTVPATYIHRYTMHVVLHTSIHYVCCATYIDTLCMLWGSDATATSLGRCSQFLEKKIGDFFKVHCFSDFIFAEVVSFLFNLFLPKNVNNTGKC